jgi:hypothetical protein
VGSFASGKQRSRSPSTPEAADLKLVREAVKKETAGKDKGKEEKKEKDQLPLKKSLLSKELQDKFTEMKNCTSFEEREQVLRWAVEEMRSEVVEHLEASDALQDMSESQKMRILE